MTKSGILALTMLAIGLSSVAPAAAATCYYVSYWRQTHDKVELSLIEEVKELERNVALEGATTLEQVLSALKVVNKQYSGEESRQQQTVKASQEAYTNATNEQLRNERIVQIKESYGYETGQGANACAQTQFLGQVTTALSGMPGDAAATYKRLDVAPGAVPSPAQQAAVRLDPASTDASVLMSASSDRAAKDKVIQQLAGYAVNKPAAQESGTVGGEFQYIRARQAEAWRSPALISMAAVSAMGNSSSLGVGDSAGSVLQAMDSLISNYGGGPAYQTWTAALQGQSERGLLIELSRLRAQSMRLRTFLNDAEARKAAVFAALLAAEASGGN